MTARPWTVEEYLHRLGSAEAVGNAAALLVEGEYPDEVPVEQRPGFSHGLLRWAVSESPTSAVHWSAIAGVRPGSILGNRDRYVLELWRALDTHPEHEGFRQEYFDRWQVREPYERHLFDWFLTRLDLPSAVGLVGGRRHSYALYWVLLGILGAAVPGRFIFFGHGLRGSWMLGLSLGLAAAVAAWRTRWPFYVCVQALVPRLGVAVGIGYLFFLASPELMEVVRGWSAPLAVQLATGALLVGLVWSYGALEVSRRVEPPPTWRRAYRRSGPVVAMGMAHSLVGVGVLVPLLEAVLSRSGGGSQPAPLAGHDLFLYAVVALALGVALELAWAERPITEPLG
jgi:hypothetical protein